jgi:hypothetical protein
MVIPRRAHQILTLEDFAVEMLSKEQLLRMRDEVERELEATVGWTATAQASDSFAPKDFLRRVQTTMLQLERESAGASAQGMSWNLWVTGSSTVPLKVLCHLESPRSWSSSHLPRQWEGSS